jgi:hypothetical protein
MTVPPAPRPHVGRRQSDAVVAVEQQLEVAIAIVGMICREVDSIDDRRMIVADVVYRWRALDPQTRTAFCGRSSAFTALTRFAWDYVDDVERGNAEERPGDDYDDSLFRVWSSHVRRLRGQ